MFINSPIEIKTETIDSDIFKLTVSMGNYIVVYNDKNYQNLNDLINDAPSLRQPQALATAVKIVNFMIYGLRYHCIENIEEFQKSYLESVRSEKTAFSSIQDIRLSAYGTYDVSQISPPRIEKNRWIFFVVDSTNRIPKRVSFELPTLRKPFHCKYELLPALKS